jgi:hypothetical protein
MRRAEGSRMAVPFLGHLLVGNSGSPLGGPFLYGSVFEPRLFGPAPSGSFEIGVAFSGFTRRTPAAMRNSGQ